MPSNLSDQPDSAADLVGVRVLVVEDEYLLAEVIEDAFSEMGADVVGPASTVDEALALIESEQFEVALLDVKLRGESVVPLAEALDGRGTPFAFLTGYRKLPELRSRFPDSPIFEKPIKIAALQETMIALLQGKTDTLSAQGPDSEGG